MRILSTQWFRNALQEAFLNHMMKPELYCLSIEIVDPKLHGMIPPCFPKAQSYLLSLRE